MWTSPRSVTAREQLFSFLELLLESPAFIVQVPVVLVHDLKNLGGSSRIEQIEKQK